MIGAVLEGRWRVVEKVGEGGMAEVFLAEDPVAGVRAAVKIFPAALAGDDTRRRRFVREIEACGRLEHPNVVQLFGAGSTPDGGLFFAMEYLPHPPLGAVLKERGRFAPDAVLAFVRQLGSAFAHCHARAIVHRDVKPSNILVAPGRYVLMDFGLARDLLGGDLTKTGTVLGSPVYMSPELTRGVEADGRSDLYQLGVIAYELLTGRRAFNGATFDKVFAEINKVQPPPPSSLVPGIPPAWDAFLARCMAKRPDGRFRSAEELLRGAEELDVTGATGSLWDPASSSSPSPSPSRSLPVPLRPRHLLLALAACAAAFLLVLSLRPSAPPPSDDVLSLRAEPLPGALLVTWTTGAAGPTRLEVEQPAGATWRALGADPATSHAAVVEGLGDGVPCSFRVVHASGARALAQRAAAGRLALSIEEASPTTEGLRLVLRTEPVLPGEVRVLTAAGPGSPFALVALPGRGRQGATLSDVPPWAVDVLATFSLPGGGRREVRLGRVLDGQVAGLCATLGSLDPAALSRDMLGDIGPSPDYYVDALARVGDEDLPRAARERKEQAARARPVLQARLEACPALEGWRRASALSGLALGTRLLPVTARTRLMEGLTRVHVFRLFCCFQGAPVELPPWPDPGAFGAAAQPLPGRARELVVLAPREPPLQMGLKVPLSGLTGVPRWEGTVDVPFEPCGAAAAELRFEVGAFPGIALRVSVNGLPDLVLPDLRRLPQAEGGVADGPPALFQRLPPDVLRRGENTLSLAVDTLLGRWSRQTIPLTSLTLRLVGDAR